VNSYAGPTYGYQWDPYTSQWTYLGSDLIPNRLGYSCYPLGVSGEYGSERRTIKAIWYNLNWTLSQLPDIKRCTDESQVKTMCRRW
jgi:hypothetical protein